MFKIYPTEVKGETKIGQDILVNGVRRLKCTWQTHIYHWFLWYGTCADFDSRISSDSTRVYGPGLLPIIDPGDISIVESKGKKKVYKCRHKGNAYLPRLILKAVDGVTTLSLFVATLIVGGERTCCLLISAC